MSASEFAINRDSWIERRLKERQAQASRAQTAIERATEASMKTDYALMALRTRNADGIQEGAARAYLEQAVSELQAAIKALDAK